MALTEQEKATVREIICNQFGQQADGMGVLKPVRKPVTPELLKAFAEKSDEEVRAEIVIYNIKKKKYLELQKAKLAEQVAKLDAELKVVP